MKRDRSGNDIVPSAAALLAELLQLASLRKPGFDWDLSAYSKTRRSQGPCRDGLQTYKPLLKVLLKFCPHCKPGHVMLRECWKSMVGQYPDIKTSKESVSSWASSCADTSRMMLKHVHDVALSGSPFLSLGLGDLVSLVAQQAEDTPHREEEIGKAGIEPFVGAHLCNAVHVPRLQACRGDQLRVGVVGRI